MMEDHCLDDSLCPVGGRQSWPGDPRQAPAMEPLRTLGPQFQRLESMGLNFDLKVPPVSRVTAIAPSIAPQSLN